MWLITNDIAGLLCAFFTYFTVVFVYLGFIRIGIWEGLQEGDSSAIIQWIIFQYHCFMIFWSHFKCMTTPAGHLPKQVSKLNLNLLPSDLQHKIKQIAARCQMLQVAIEEDSQKEPAERKTRESLNSTDINDNDVNNEDADDEEKGMIKAPNNGQMYVDERQYQTILGKVEGQDLEDVCSEGSIVIKEIEEEKRIEIDYQDNLLKAEIKFIDQLLGNKCKKCESVKAPKSHHCSICKTCVARMDHHCPWVNNCVGCDNQKFFLQFLIYVFLGSFHALALMTLQGIKCIDEDCYMFTPVDVCVIAALSIFLALLFALFVVVMFCDQLCCIANNTNTIDKLKEKRDKKAGKRSAEKVGKKSSRTGWQNICEVMTGDYR